MIKVKIMLTLQIDPEDYPVPSDGDVTEDFEDYMNELFHDLEGVTVKNMRILME